MAGPCDHVKVFYWVVKAILGPLLHLVFRPWAEGTENVPRAGPAIIASNHLSFSDHFFGPLPLPRKVVFLAKSEYFTGRGLKGLFSKAFFRGVGQIPVDRSGGEASERALATGLRVLAAGNLLGIYPEGTRTPDGRLFRGKTGVARLALEARVPVVPCAMVGGFEFQPPGRIAPRLRIRPGVRFGEPLDFSRYYGMENDKLVLRAVTDEIMYEIMRLSGQEYVDEYEQDYKARLQAARHGGGRSPAGGMAGPAPAAGPGSAPVAPGGAAGARDGAPGGAAGARDGAPGGGAPADGGPGEAPGLNGSARHPAPGHPAPGQSAAARPARCRAAPRARRRCVSLPGRRPSPATGGPPPASAGARPRPGGPARTAGRASTWPRARPPTPRRPWPARRGTRPRGRSSRRRQAARPAPGAGRPAAA